MKFSSAVIGVCFVTNLAAAAVGLSPFPCQDQYVIYPAGNHDYQLEAFNRCAHLKGNGFALARDRTGNLLWKIDWYARGLALADDGIHLVRYGDEVGNDADQLSDLAVAFYAGGKELRKYSVGDLIHDRSKIISTPSGYVWRTQKIPIKWDRSRNRPTYLLVMADGTRYAFDLTTGQILKNERSQGGVAGHVASHETAADEATRDGVHVVRYGGLGTDAGRLSDLAVAFFAHGKELGKYLVKDLLRDRSKVVPTPVGYVWRMQKVPIQWDYSKSQLTCILIVADGTRYVFDLATGRIL